MDPAARTLFNRAGPWLGALALSLLLHGWLLQAPALRRSLPTAAAALRITVLLRVQQQAVPMSALAPAPPQHRPATQRVATRRVAPQRVATRTVAPHTVAAAVPTAATVAAPVITAIPPPPATVPGPADWHYLLRQNGQDGTARLSWQPQDDGSYRLSLTRELAGRPLPGWRSEGQVVPGQGLAPSRFAQLRLGRDTRATNFRRAEGLISFSASTEQVSLPPGVQDRLSWWLQLAALVAAAPARFEPGSEARLMVAGLRGEAREWVFEVLALAPLTLADGQHLPAVLPLRRAALGPYDDGVEIWLDPTRGHLPVRVRVGAADKRGWDLLLQSANGQEP